MQLVILVEYRMRRVGVDAKFSTVMPASRLTNSPQHDTLHNEGTHEQSLWFTLQTTCNARIIPFRSLYTQHEVHEHF